MGNKWNRNKHGAEQKKKRSWTIWTGNRAMERERKEWTIDHHQRNDKETSTITLFPAEKLYQFHQIPKQKFNSIKFDVGEQTPAHCFFSAAELLGAKFHSNLNVDEQTTAHCFPGAEVFRAKSVYMWVDLCYMRNLAEIHFSQIWVLVGIDTCSLFFRSRGL